MKILIQCIRPFFLWGMVVLIRCSAGHTTQPDTTHDTIAALQFPDSIQVIKLGTGTDFRFKGLAIDPAQQDAYLGSWDRKQIVKVSLHTGKVDILSTKYNDKLNGMGCYIRDGILYAVMNEVDDLQHATPISALLLFQLSTGELMRSYELKGLNGRNHFNHVVADERGVVYISNTLKSNIVFVDTNEEEDSLKVLVEHSDLSWVHGLDLSDDGTVLFSTSYRGGIKFFDLRNRKFSAYRDTTLAGDDGLKYHKGSLYGVGKNSIKRYTLDEDLSKVIAREVILNGHNYFNDPRCLYIVDNTLYCLANIGFEPVVFHDASTARDTPLDDSYLIRLKL